MASGNETIVSTAVQTLKKKNLGEVIQTAAVKKHLVKELLQFWNLKSYQKQKSHCLNCWENSLMT